MLQQKQSLTKQLQDQTSKVTQTVTDAHDIGYGDGLGKRVDALSQKYDGLETNINLRENRLDQKTQQYIAKLADLNQIGRYLQTYTKTINQQQVPVMRQLILAMQQGITIDTSNVTKSVYQEFQALTGHTIQEVIKTAVSDGFKRTVISHKRPASRRNYRQMWPKMRLPNSNKVFINLSGYHTF